MSTLFAAFLLLLTPQSLPTYDGENAEESPRRSPDYTVDPMMDHPATLWLSIQHGDVVEYHDDDSDLRELGRITIVDPATGEPMIDPETGDPIVLDTGARISSTVLHLGGSYAVYRDQARKVGLGVDLGLADQTLRTDTVVFNQPREQSSGFSAQNLTLFAELDAPVYTVRAGYLFDLGPDPDIQAEQRPNSDRQDAITLGASGQYEQASFRVFGGFDAFFTLEQEGITTGLEQEMTFDEGDVYALHGGGGFQFGNQFEIGAALIFRVKSAGGVEGLEDETVAAVFLGQPNPYDNSSALSIAPYVTYRAADSPFQVYLKGAVQREYYDYGYTVAGTNDIAPRLGAAFGIQFGL